MPAGWVAAAVGVASAVSGGNEAKWARGDQERARLRQYGLAERELEMAEEQWDRFKEYYAPVEEALSEEAMEGPQYEKAEGQAIADTEMAYDKIKDERERTMGRYGIDPSSGRYADIEGEESRNKAKSEILARNVAREQEDDKTWSRKFAFSQMGRGLQSAAAGTVGDAGRAVGGIADSYGKMAEAASRRSAQGAEAIGYWGTQAANNNNSFRYTGNDGGTTDQGDKYKNTDRGPVITDFNQDY